MLELHGYRVGADGQLWQWHAGHGQQVVCCSLDAGTVLAELPIESAVDYWYRQAMAIKLKASGSPDEIARRVKQWKQVIGFKRGDSDETM